MFALQGPHLRKEIQEIAPAENSLLLFRKLRCVYREEGLVTVSPYGLPLNCIFCWIFKLFLEHFIPVFFLLSTGWARGVLSREKRITFRASPKGNGL